MRWFYLFLQSCLLVIVCFSSTQAALTVQGYQPELHDRFVNDPDFIGVDYDWSGVGRTSGRWGTLISPSFILSVNHFPASGTMRFYQTNDPNGPFEERSIVQSIAIQQDGYGGVLSDIRLSRLNAPVTNSTHYSILDLPNTADYLNQTIFTFGRSDAAGFLSQRLGRNQIEAIIDDVQITVGTTDYRSDVFLFDYDDPGGVGADEAMVQSGDSGAPSFVIVHGRPVLVGLHWFNYLENSFNGQFGRGSGDSFVSRFVDELNREMAGTGSSERVSVVTVVPEPGSWCVVLAVTALFAGCRRLRS